ncbi:MAG: DUF190 domain-containing protein [Sphingomonadales bacterium]|nr:DUF190 domain-containing protein [Sphingomonadales bacterium]
MTVSRDDMLLRIYTDDAAMHGDDDVVDVIVRRARTTGLAGATVLRGRVGFASGSAVHEHHSFGIGDNPPMVIELVDAESKLRAFLPMLADLRGIGLATLEKVEIVTTGLGDTKSKAPDKRKA